MASSALKHEPPPTAPRPEPPSPHCPARPPAGTLPPPLPVPPQTGRPLRDVFDPLEVELEQLRKRARE